MSLFLFGLAAPLFGFRALFSSRRLKVWAMLPILAAVFVFLVFGVFGLVQVMKFNPMVTEIVLEAIGLNGVNWAWWVIAIGLWPIWLLLLGLILYLIARLIAAPFYSLLAEQALIEIGAKPAGDWKPFSWVALTAKMAWISLLKSLIFGVFGLIVFAVSLVPGLNLLAALAFVHLVAFDICDYSFEALEWPLGQRFSHFQKNWPAFSGFAVSLGISMLVPGLNLLLLPGAVVGGALTVQRTLKKSEALIDAI